MCIRDRYKNISICIIDAVTMFALYLFSGYLIIRGKFSIGTAFAFITYVGYISHLVMHAVTQRIDVHMEKVNCHPMEIRRYYRCLDY